MTHATVFGKIDSYQITETGASLASTVRDQDVNINIIKFIVSLNYFDTLCSVLRGVVTGLTAVRLISSLMFTGAEPAAVDRGKL